MTDLELHNVSKGRDKYIPVQSNVKELLAVQKRQTQINQVDGTWRSQDMASYDASVKFMWMGQTL